MAKLKYLSLFSGAGIGCYGFSQEKFECLATNELLERRMQFQKYNNICSESIRYIAGDIKNPSIKSKVMELGKTADVILATPPCQGMSVANHKKKNELNRNSLVVESIKIIKEIEPKYFIFENVRSFMKTLCTDLDGSLITIEESINRNLSSSYHLHSKVINLAEYGSNSSRTRTLVIGTHNSITYASPIDLFPDMKKTSNLKKIIGNLRSLKVMGQIDEDDIYHFFRSYDSRMRPWITDLKEGQSAFDNIEPNKIPHQIINGKRVINKSSNGDKYKRNKWEKIGPCVHTRNDILASQNTIHPTDDRVFSIRELMLLMSIPRTFKWSDIDEKKLNLLKDDEKRKFLKSIEINIRQSIGEAVPTAVFQSIAKKINAVEQSRKSKKDIIEMIGHKSLHIHKNLLNFINKSDYSFELQRIIELANNSRIENKAFYTSPSVCFSLVNSLPKFSNNKTIRILEPSVGCGNFIPHIISRYSNCKKVYLDLVDIDEKSIELTKALIKKLNVPENFIIRFLNQNYLEALNNEDLFYSTTTPYDLIVGNPPFGKMPKEEIAKYKHKYQNDSKNLFSYFIEKSLKISKYVAFISPKSFVSAPEFSSLRKIVEKRKIIKIHDHGEKAFDSDVKIETIGLIVGDVGRSDYVIIDSLITKKIRHVKTSYMISKKLPYWILYRNKKFDQTLKKIHTNTFNVFRDRQITKKLTKPNGKYRVIKSRNIGDGSLVNIEGYDCFIDDISKLAVKKFLNQNVVLVPNLTYYPRAMFLPKNSIVDGSAAILIPKLKINKRDLKFFASNEFHDFYRIARNYGTRSLNIDSSSVYFFGKLKNNGSK